MPPPRRLLLVLFSFALFWAFDRGGKPMLTLEDLCIAQDDFRLTANFAVPSRRAWWR